MPFYAHPTDLVSPGDLFPEIPIAICVPPLKIARKSKYNAPAKFGPQDLRRIYSVPGDGSELKDLKLSTKHGEESLAWTRVGPVIFLSWGSQVEADERELRIKGKPQNKGWLAAPIYKLDDIPHDATIEDPETNERINIRTVVRNNASHNYFYLPPMPDFRGGEEYYVDFRKINAVGISFFLDSKSKRIASLSEESLNLLFSRLMWFFTRAEYFFRPIRCLNCGEELAVDIRFEGQNFEAEPWE